MKIYILISVLVALIASTNGLPRRIKKLNNALGIPKESEVLWDILDIANLTLKVDGFESLLADYETALNERDNVIMAMNTSISTLQALVLGLENVVASNAADISALSADSSANAAGISSNIAGISSNTAGIETIVTDVATNTGLVNTQADQISGLENVVLQNLADITANSEQVASNQADIIAVSADSSANAAGISSNIASISSNTADIATVASDVATNTGDIASNVANIASNQVDVQSNLQSILNISADVVVNTANISLNTDAITELIEGKPSINPCEDITQYNTFTSYKRIRTRASTFNQWQCDEAGYDKYGGPSDDWYGTGWYRFTGSAGNRLATSIVEGQHCGAYYGGHLVGGSASEPTIAGSVVNATACFWKASISACERTFDIQIRHCPGFLLYYLPEIENCHNMMAYCGQL